MPSRRDYTCNNSIWQPFFASSCISPTEPGWDLTNPHTKRPHQLVRQLVDVAYTRKKVFYSTLLHPTLLYSTLLPLFLLSLLYFTLLYSTLLYSTLLYSTLLYPIYILSILSILPLHNSPQHSSISASLSFPNSYSSM